jgi:uncharacterized protein (TIGR04255 family)
MITRPTDLPDFAQPPLNEVVLGVQFEPAQGYSQVRAGEVWSLFKDHFPIVEEHTPLAPTFEAFGRPSAPQMQLGFITGASHDRFWFLTPGKDQLIQFQQDRLLHNWRKVGDERNPYPRFESMIVCFEREIRSLESYFASLSPQALAINQCEISYINQIPLNDEYRSPEAWLRYVQLRELNVDDFNVSFRRVLRKDGQPVGRLSCEAVTAIAKSQLVLRLSLTARGTPPRPDVQAALEMLCENREIVVKAFAEVTTDSAHKIWQRTQ